MTDLVSIEEYGCCALEHGHDGPCAWICPECNGSQRCHECGDLSVEDLGGCGECGSSGGCSYCDEGMVRVVEEVRDLRALQSPSVKRSRRPRFQIYLDRRDAWVGVYVSSDAVYVLLLPFVVMRWRRD